MRDTDRGIVLIITLLMLILVGMFVTASIALAPGTLASSAQFDARQAAVWAAEAGLEYATVRLQEDRTWIGGTGKTTVVQALDDSVVVVEDNGNVVGFLRAPDGQPVQFRLRFNFQDGSPGLEGLSDPDPEDLIDHPYVCVNNLGSAAAQPVRRADGPGYSVTGTSAAPYEVPGSTACILVEGRAGAGLRDLTSANPNAAPVRGRPLTTRVVEAYLKADFSDVVNAVIMAGQDFAVVLPEDSSPLVPPIGKGKGKGKGDFGSNPNPGKWVVLGSTDSKVPGRARIKTLGAVLDPSSAQAKFGPARGKGLSGLPAEAYTADGTFNALYKSGDVQLGTEPPEAGFYALSWDDVQKADSAPATTNTVHLKGGTYVWWDKPGGDPELHYYNLSYADYKTAVAANPNLPADAVMPMGSNLAQVRTNLATVPDPVGEVPLVQLVTGKGVTGKGIPSYTEKPRMVIRENVYVVPDPPATGARDFVLIPRGGAAEAPPAPGGPVPGQLYDGAGSRIADVTGDTLRPIDFDFEFAPTQSGDPGQAIFSLDGDFYLGGGIQGEGASVTAAGDLRVVGAATKIVQKPLGGKDIFKSAVNLYSRGDLELNTLDLSGVPGDWTAGYNDLSLEGVMYTWGNLTARLMVEDPSTVDSSVDLAIGKGKGSGLSKAGYIKVEGAVVAYGADPGTSAAPGSAGNGSFRVWADGASFIYNGAYVQGLNQPQPGAKLRRILWTEY